jgi:hypothetical protein
MNDAQTEIERLRREIAELKKKLGEKQQLTTPKSLPALRNDYEFVVDLARFSEALLSEQAVRKKYHFTEETWTALGTDDALCKRVEEEKLRRVRDGSYKRERSQQLVTKAPLVADGIMMDPKANAKHRLSAAQLLDSFAGFTSENTADEERVIVTINLGSDVLRFGGAVRPTPNDSDGEIIEPGVPGFMLTKKDGNDGGQQPI